MIKSGRLVRLLTSRRQHITLSRLELCKVGILPKVHSNRVIRTSRSATLCQDSKFGNISLSDNIGFLQHFFNDKTSLGLFEGKRLITKLIRGNFYIFWSFQFLSNCSFEENMTKFNWCHGSCWNALEVE